MIAVSIQESGLSEGAANISDAPAYGGSMGPFQLNQDPAAHPNTDFVAVNPWYDYGYPEIRDRWEGTWKNQGSWTAFLDDPETFLQYFAPAAQGSVEWSYNLAVQRLREAEDILRRIE